MQDMAFICCIFAPVIGNKLLEMLKKVFRFG